MKRLSPYLLLAGAVAVVYLNSFRGVFQFDDYNVIVDNGGVHIWGAYLAGLPREIRPLLKFTYTLNWTSGLGLFGFHLVNVGLHAANTVMLFFLASRVGGPSVSLMAFFYLGEPPRLPAGPGAREPVSPVPGVADPLSSRGRLQGGGAHPSIHTGPL